MVEKVRSGVSIPLLVSQREIGVQYERFARSFVDYRIYSLEASKQHNIPMLSGEIGGITAINFDSVDNEMLLCGSSRGAVSIVDMTDSRRYKKFEADRRSSHKYLITSCQWYPTDTSLFVTAAMDQTVKLWDSNRLVAVDEYKFERPISQIHWGTFKNNSIVAVSLFSSNVHFIDPRTGNAIHHLRCGKAGHVQTLCWKRNSNFCLLTGSDTGKIFLWDIRAGKNELAQLHAEKVANRKKKFELRDLKAAHTNPVLCVKETADGEKIVSMSLNRTVNCWDASSLAFEGSLQMEECEPILSKTSLFFDTCHEGSKLWAFIPTDNNLAVQDLSLHSKLPTRLLQGHFQTVTCCVYREKFHQLVTASTDRLTLVWSPRMDEKMSEHEETIVNQLHEDAFSDDDD